MGEEGTLYFKGAKNANCDRSVLGHCSLSKSQMYPTSDPAVVAPPSHIFWIQNRGSLCPFPPSSSFLPYLPPNTPNQLHICSPQMHSFPNTATTIPSVTTQAGLAAGCCCAAAVVRLAPSPGVRP